MNQSNIIMTLVQIFALYFAVLIIFYTYKLFTTKDEIKRSYKKRLLPFMLTLGVLLIIYVGARLMFTSYGVNNMSTSQGYPGPNFSYTSGGMMLPSLGNLMPSPRYQENTKSIADTREFMKSNYSGNIQTRKVEEVAQKVKLLIKGSNGRIDSSNVSTNSAYFNFVIPKSELDNFEEQIRTYVNPKLYTQTISTQNLLTDKQNLERDQQDNTQATIALTQEQKKVEASYKTQVSSLKTQISSKEKEVSDIRLKQTPSTDENTLASLQYQEQVLSNQLQNLKNSLSQATSTFNTQMSALGLSLADQAKISNSLDTKENDFFDNIETVQGTVYISKVSTWQIISTLSPINPIIVIAILLAIFKIISVTKREKTIIPAVLQ